MSNLVGQEDNGLITGLGDPVRYAGTPSNGTDEIVTLTMTGTPTGGTMKFSFDGYETSALAYNASAATVQAALEALPSIGSGNVTVTGTTWPDHVYTVTFISGRGKMNVGAITLSDNSMTGGTTPTVAVAVSVSGVDATFRSCPKGALLLDTTNGVLYQNTGSAGAPTWSAIGATGASPVTAVRNETGGTLAAGTLVYISGWNETEGMVLVSKADADAQGKMADGVLRAAILDSSNGSMFSTYRLTGQNTNGATVGDPVYLSTTAGGWTLTNPSTGSANAIEQIVGRVAIVHASTGVVEFNVQVPTIIGTNELSAGAVTQAKIDPNSLDDTVVKNVANVNVLGGIPVLFRIDVADASGDTDVTVTHKIRVLDAWGLNTGSAAHATLDTWQVKNGSNAISDAVAKTATVNAVKRISTIDPARHEIAAGGTLRITAAKNTNAAVTVYVLAIRVA